MNFASYSSDWLILILQSQLKVTSSERFSLATLSSVATSLFFLLSYYLTYYSMVLITVGPFFYLFPFLNQEYKFIRLVTF